MSSIGRIKLSNSDLRENFDVAIKMLAKANGIQPQQVDPNNLTQGYIRSPIDLTTGQSVFQFPMSTLDQASISGAPLTPITQLVASVDAFVAGQMGYYLMIYQFITNQQTPDFTSGNMWMPVTYPSPYDNNGTGIDWSPGCAMFWLGYLKIEVNSKVLYKAYDLMRHYLAPRTQATGASPNPQAGQKNEYDGGNDAFYPLEPLPVFSGSKQNVVQAYYPANIPTTIAPFNMGGIGYGSTFIAKAVLHFRGVTCQNASGLK